MSDGPHRTLNMRRGWKKAAKFADKPAYTAEEVGGAVASAVAQDWQIEVGDSVSRSVCEILRVQQDSLFSDQKAMQLEALRPLAAGHGLAQLLIDCALHRINGRAPGQDAAAEAAAEALGIWAARHARQIEEHYLRESSTHRAENVRTRIEGQVSVPALAELARQFLDQGAHPSLHAPRKQSGVDDGVRL